MGTLPDGQIVIGYGKNDPEYYVKLMELKDEYLTALKSSKNLEHVKIAMSAFSLIVEKYPDLEGYEHIKIHQDNWMKIPNDYYEITDVTKKIDNMLKECYYDDNIQSYFFKNSTSKVIKLFELTGPNMKYDLKNNDNWYHQLYIYNKEIIDVDTFGNIFYGFIGREVGINKDALYRLSDQFHQLYYRDVYAVDDERDTLKIKQGITLYEAYTKK